MSRSKGTGYIFKRGKYYHLEYKINKTRKVVSLRVEHLKDRKLENGTVIMGAQSKAADILGSANDAKTKHDVIINIAEQRGIIERSNIKLYDAFRYFEVRYKNTHKPAESTFLNYIRQWDRYLAWMKTNHPDITDPRHVSGKIAEDYWGVINQLAASTANQHLTTLKVVFESLKDKGVLLNPWEKISSLPPDGLSKEYLNEEQISHLFHSFSPGEANENANVGYFDLFHAGKNTGQRLGDCCLLSWENINLNLDRDGIPDQDDYHISGDDFDEPLFTEMKIRFPEAIDLNNCKIKFDYDTWDTSSSPSILPNATFRLWTKQSNEERDPAAIAPVTSSETGGDYIPSGTYINSSSLPMSGNEATIFIQAYSGNNTDKSMVTVTITPISSTGGSTEAHLIKSYSFQDKVLLSVLGILLNFPDPIPTASADTLLVTNIANEAGNRGKPDYANFDQRQWETSLLQLDMTILTGNLAKENFKIKFEYDGLSSLTSISESAITSGLEDIFMRGDKEYFDYTPFKSGTVRVWASSKPI